jgi:hypothetical protein
MENLVNLYDAIFRRKSVRKYKMEPLSMELMFGLQKEMEALEPLLPHIPYSLEVASEEKVRGLFTIRAPHYLCLYSDPKQEGAYENAGYLMEQVALILSARGLGGCWLGAAKPPKVMAKSALVISYNSATAEIERIDELEERLLEKNEAVARYLDNLTVINKTKDMLAEARDSMTAKYLDKTRQGFKKYVTLIDNECGDFTMDTSFTISKTDLGKSRQAEAYSRGTRDLHSLAIRLSLVDALYADDTPPLILDDPFIAFDDSHIEKAIAVIKKLADDRQIIYFTCSKSRRAK